MKKSALGGALVLAGILAATVAGTTQADQAPADSNPLLAFVPDDTVFFAGGLAPFAYGEMMAFSSSLNWRALSTDERASFQTVLDESAAPGVRMFAGMLLELFSVDKFEKIPALLGLSDTFNSALYAVGAAPMLRLELADANAFEAFIAKVEKDLAVPPLQADQGDLSYRRYLLSEHESLEQPWYLAISVNDGVASVFLESQELGGEQVTAYGLGLVRPERALAGSQRLHSMTREHGFLPSGLAYLDHRELIRALTDPEGNRLSRVLTTITDAMEPQQAAWVHELRGAACRQDMAAIADAWPRTSMGYTRLDFSDPAVMEAAVVIESRDQQTMAALGKLRGHMPMHLGNPVLTSPFGLGLGINTNALGPFIQETWQRLVSADYGCAPLQTMQAQLRGSNPAMVSMMLTMAAGMKGLSLSLQALELGPAAATEASTSAATGPADDRPVITDLSALLTVSAEDPASLLRMLQAMVPWLAQVQIPADGSPTPVMLPMAEGVEGVRPMIALRGSHIALYTGAPAEAIALTLDRDRLQTNGFLSVDFDYSLYGAFLNGLVLVDALDDPAAQAQLQELADTLSDSGLQAAFTLDFSSKGIVLQSRLTQTRPD